MTEEEALLRAREAHAVVFGSSGNNSPEAIRRGQWDSHGCMKATVRALLDIDKPLPVDPDLEALREIFVAHKTSWQGEVVAEEWRRGEYDAHLRDILPLFRKHIEARAKALVEANVRFNPA